MDEQELADIEDWYNNPPAGEDYWQRVFNSGRVMGRLIEAVRTERERVKLLEVVREAAQELRKVEKGPTSPHLPVDYSLAVCDLLIALRKYDEALAKAGEQQRQS